MAASIFVTDEWTTVLAEDEAMGESFSPVGTGLFSLSYQGLASGQTVSIQHMIDGEWVGTGDSIGTDDLAQDIGSSPTTYSGSWTARLRHGDEYRAVSSAAGPVVKAALISKEV